MLITIAKMWEFRNRWSKTGDTVSSNISVIHLFFTAVIHHLSPDLFQSPSSTFVFLKFTFILLPALFQNENLTVLLSCLKLFNNLRGPRLNYVYLSIFPSVDQEEVP